MMDKQKFYAHCWAWNRHARQWESVSASSHISKVRAEKALHRAIRRKHYPACTQPMFARDKFKSPKPLDVPVGFEFNG